MATTQEQLARLRRYNLSVRENDPKLAEEVRDRGFEAMVTETVSPQAAEEMLGLESIAMRTQRPVLAIRDNVTRLVFIDEADSKIWGERLTKARPLLDIAIPAVGRIDLMGAQLEWVGTGWLVAENIIVTNRHVAREFAERKGDGFAFKTGLREQMGADVDFLEEIDNPKKLVFKLVRPLHIEEPPGPDVAFFEIEMVSGDARLARPIELATTIGAKQEVATIGYPAYDSRIPEPDLMERIYGKVYNKKRLAPGSVTRLEEALLWHNCTTLGGNSGSVVFDLNSGEALGLHFRGSFLVTNYAVRADVVKRLLADVRAGRAIRRTETTHRPQRPVAQPGRPSILRPTRGGSANLTIPLTVSISLGFDPVSLGASVRYRMPAVPAGGEPAEFIAETEAVASDYRDRRGYNPAFLGERLVVDLPAVNRNADDVLNFEFDGTTETQLRYEHFSVVMSRSRRMCFLSACNIDGNQSRKSARVTWKWDPRIPKAQQIMHECYGNPPKFSRGHMTRREDPGWGSPVTSKRGSEELDARHQHDAADAGVQRADMARARRLRPAARPRGRNENLGLHGALLHRQRSRDVRRAHPACLLEGDRVHPRRNREAVRNRLRDGPGEDPPTGGGIRVRRLHFAPAWHRDAGAHPLDRKPQRDQFRKSLCGRPLDG